MQDSGKWKDSINATLGDDEFLETVVETGEELMGGVRTAYELYKLCEPLKYCQCFGSYIITHTYLYLGMTVFSHSQKDLDVTSRLGSP